MPKYFPSYTHTTVKSIKNEIDSIAMNNTIALVSIHFGDACAIQHIAIKKMHLISGVIAHIPMSAMIVDNKKEWYSIVTGPAAEELKLLALVAFDRVKQLHGLKYNRTYRVSGTDAILIKQENQNESECSTTLG